MPLSSELADAVLALRGRRRARPLSSAPMLRPRAHAAGAGAAVAHCRAGHLLVEQYRRAKAGTSSSTRLPAATCTWAWRSLLAWRLARTQPNTFSLSVNDYGLEMLAAKPVDVVDRWLRAGLHHGPDLMADVLASLNSSELAQRRFREIARVAGLVFGGYPGAPKSTRQLQARAACSTRCSASTTPATACWPRPSRGAGAGAGTARLAHTCSSCAQLAPELVTLRRAQPVCAAADGGAACASSSAPKSSRTGWTASQHPPPVQRRLEHPSA
jgi:hypothetical protein